MKCAPHGARIAQMQRRSLCGGAGGLGESSPPRGGPIYARPRTPGHMGTGRRWNMQLGMIGLGRMGANMVRRLMRAGHDCVVYDRDEGNVQALARDGATGTSSRTEFVAALSAPRTVWLMIPAGAVDGELAELVPLLESNDIVIDGGNSFYHNDIRRAEELRPQGIHYVDVGVSGGVWGLERGYCLMIGGEDDIVKRLDPIFSALAPGVGLAARTPAREKA